MEDAAVTLGIWGVPLAIVGGAFDFAAQPLVGKDYPVNFTEMLACQPDLRRLAALEAARRNCR